MYSTCEDENSISIKYVFGHVSVKCRKCCYLNKVWLSVLSCDILRARGHVRPRGGSSRQQHSACALAPPSAAKWSDYWLLHLRKWPALWQRRQQLRLRPAAGPTSFHCLQCTGAHQSNHTHTGPGKHVCTVCFTLLYWCHFQVQVCTVFACVRSDVTQTTTVEDLPADLGAPLTQVISPR